MSDPAPAPRSLLPAVALLAVACGPKHATPDPALVIRYAVELTLETQTRMLRVEPPTGLAEAPAVAPPPVEASEPPPVEAGEPPPVEAGEPPPVEAAEPPGASTPAAPLDPVAEALAPLAQDAVQVQLAVELSPSRAFDDGSLGWRVRVAEAHGTTLGAPDAPAAPVALALGGRSVELRTFPDGEVLALADSAHLVGPGRLGEVVDLLLPILSPFPPPLEDGATARRTSRWPFTLDGNNGWRHALYGEWRNLGLEQTALGEAWHLSWQGPLEGGGKDRRQTPPVGVLTRGEGAGEVWLGTAESVPVPLRVLRHDFQWRREAEIEFPAAAGGPVRVVQEQRVQGQLRRVSPAVTP